MTPEFAKAMKKTITEWKKAGTEPLDAYRETERACGKANEEFRPDGPLLIESIYGGVFVGGQAGDFRPVESTK